MISSTQKARRRRRHTVSAAALVAGALAGATPAFGTAYTWNAATGTTALWSSSASWSPVGVPVAGDTVTYSAAGTFTTTFSGNHVADAATFSNGAVTWRSNGSTSRTLNLLTGAASLTLNTPGTASLAIGTPSNNPLAVTVGGTLTMSGGGTSTLTVEGPSASTALTVQGIGSHTVGFNGGTSTINVRGGSQFNLANGALNLGNSGVAATRGNLNIATGSDVILGSLAAGTNITVTAGQGHIDVSGAGSTLTVSGAMLLGTNSGGGAASMTVSSGALVGVGAGSAVQTTGTLTINGGTFVDSSNGMTIRGTVDVLAGTIDFGNNVSVVGGTVNLAGTQNIDDTINVTTAGKFNSSGTLNVVGGAIGYASGTTGTLNTLNLANASTGVIFQTATVTAGSIAVGTSTGAANLAIAGNLTQTGASPLAINANITGNHGVTIETTGNYISGTGGITVTNSRLTVEGSGRFTANGNLTLNSGAVFENSSNASLNFTPGIAITANNGSAINLNGDQTLTNIAFNASGASASVELGNVSGSLTTFNIQSSVTLGNLANVNATNVLIDDSTLTLNGATFTTEDFDFEGGAIGAVNSGTLRVEGEAVVRGASSLREFAGGAINLLGNVTVDSGATLQLDRNVSRSIQQIWSVKGANSTLQGSGTFSILDGLLEQTGGTIRLGALAATRGIADLSAGSFFTTLSAVTTLGSGTATPFAMRMRGGQTGDLAGSLFVAGGGSLDVESNADLRVRGAFLTIGNATSGAARVTLTGAGSTLQHDGIGIILENASILRINAGTSVAANNAVVSIDATSRIELHGGSLTVKSFETGNPAGVGVLDWTTGTLAFTTAQTINASMPLGTNVDLTFGRNLSAGTATLTLDAGTTVRLRGGSLTAGVLARDPASTFVFESGTLTLGSAHIGGPSQTNQLGSTLSIDAGSNLNVLGTTNLNGILHAGGGQITTQSLTISSSGELFLDSPVTPVVVLSTASSAITNEGLIRGDGVISGHLMNLSSGEIRVENTKRLRIDNTISNAVGRITLAGGTFETLGTLINGGDITGRGMIVASTIANHGDIALSSGITDVYGSLQNNSNGRVIVSGQADVTFWDNFSNNASASLRVSAGSSATFFGAYSGGGVTGAGDLYFEADINPGFSPAAITFGGNMTLSQTARLEMEIGGLLPGSQHDQINIAQTASLNGKMDAVAINGFQILPGDEFTVLTFASRSGDVNLSFVGNSFAGLELTKVYTANSLVLRATGLKGDANLDGSVDFDDLLILAQNYGSGAGKNWFTGDFDRTGTTEFDDLLALSQNYGSSVLRAGAPESAEQFAVDWALAQSLVPEPASITLLALTALPRRRRE